MAVIYSLLEAIKFLLLELNFFKKNMRTIITFLILAVSTTVIGQTDEDGRLIREIYSKALTQSSSYEWLRYLCKRVGHRVSGTSSYTAAVEYTKQMLDSLGADAVWLQPVTVPHWERGDIEQASIVNSKQMGNYPLSIAALGGSTATPKVGVTAEVVEVRSIDALEKMGSAAIKGKIVFFNEPMDPTIINTGHAYGKAGAQRFAGPSAAAKLGAVGALTRSLTLKRDDVPHSGMTQFEDGVTPIPCAGIGVISAEMLSELIKAEGRISVNLRLDCRKMTDKVTHNVIAEWKGSEFPNEIIVVGGHLDSWDLGEGAHDDGTGCVHAMGVLEIFKGMKIKPKRTIRCVLFANEENGMMGAALYAKAAAGNTREKHIAAIESDGGGHTPQGFSFDGMDVVLRKNQETLGQWRKLMAPYGAYYMDKGGSGADVGKLQDQGTLLFGLRVDSQRYFDYHHTKNDIFENVHKRELELGVAAMASLVYLLDTYGVK